ncbi:MAG TPA: hypothetical protein VNH22_12950 [Blastocatellia bacterium]|jgi:hypothetical protein|nr:hypothetical protein [Blastocatellia bacterium]
MIDLRRGKIIGLMLLPVAALLFIQSNCPEQGLSISKDGRRLARLKNRVSPPLQEDFEDRVTLAALLQPGDDRQRWSESRAAAIEGYVLVVKKAGIESANCYCPFRRDIHIEVALRLDAPPTERAVLEITPPMSDRAERQGWDWSAEALERELVGHWCRFEGWLLFDTHHASESENISPGRERNWRATAWEIHPITRLQVLK